MSVKMLGVIFSYSHAECNNAECHYADCHYDECCGAQSNLDMPCQVKVAAAT
jgi:hypothetical protein